MKKHRFYFVYCSICIKFENEKVQDCTNTGYFFDGKAKKWRKYLVEMKTMSVFGRFRYFRIPCYQKFDVTSITFPHHFFSIM